MKIDLKFSARDWQIPLFMQRTRFRVTVIHRRAGKTVFFVMHTIDEALRAVRPNSRFAYIAPFRKQAKDIAWDYFKRYTRGVPGVEIREADLQINLPNGSRISLYGADNIDAMRGLYFDGCVLDEGAQITQDAWESVIYPTLTDRVGWAEIGGTPKGINFLSERYEYAKNSGDPDWSYVIKNVYETGVFTEDEIEKMRRTIRRTFAQEYLCDFNTSADNALIQLDDCYAAAKRMTEVLDTEAKIIGVDVGRQGDDPSVICRRHGAVVHPLEVIHEHDLMRLAARVMHHIEDWSPDAVFVDATGGYGASLVDRLRQLKHTVIGVQFAGSADSPDRYKNKRAEMYFKMCDDLISHVRLPNDDDLFRELSAVTYKYSTSDQLMLESKDLIKTRLGGRSTDRADALALTWAYPVKSNSRRYGVNEMMRQLALASAKGNDDILWGEYS